MKTNKKMLVIFFAIAFGVPVLLGVLMGIAYGRGQEVGAFPLVWMYLPATAAMAAILWGGQRPEDGGTQLAERPAAPKGFYLTFLCLTAVMVLLACADVFLPQAGLAMGATLLVYLSSILSLVLLLAMKKERREAYGLKLTKNWKKSLGCILLFVVLYLVLSVVSSIGESLLSGSPVSLALNPQLALYLINLPISLLLGFTAFFGEEYGWRYFLQPALQERFGRRRGVIVLGLLWGIWHLPINLFYYSPESSLQSVLIQLGACVGMGVFFGWVYMRTQNVWAVTMLHFLNNNLGMTLFGASAQNVTWSWGVAALAIALYLIVYLPFLGTKEYREA